MAVIGLACRVPGADDSASFWQLLREGRDAITEVPAERWDADAFYHPDPAAPGKMNTRWGGFLKNIDQFDASFFGISPREAARMDPQQRLLLEVAWEALEDAGLQLEPLRGSQTGVFIGLSTHDYQRIQMEAGDPAHDDPYSGTGTAGSIASGRCPIALGFRDPACLSIPPVPPHSPPSTWPARV
ncbi:MAG: Phthiocerol/phenolphthiocerol synthesis polyketide synthase type I PpsB [Candidatus Hinthialibacteria bacterium OLB16]|nr:MAG: Phthiocerol/phenolphthiocerol synthesis polyketide synthase type I PpsB [Candidatus Hinthialibacteria bacterium OLB16]